MTNTMNGILSRVLSQEIAHQEQWKEEDIKRFGEDKINRDAIIADIKQFMSDNNIKFDYSWYLG